MCLRPYNASTYVVYGQLTLLPTLIPHSPPNHPKNKPSHRRVAIHHLAKRDGIRVRGEFGVHEGFAGAR